MSRLFLAAGTLALSTLPAFAGGFGCVGDCYTPTYVPPTYGAVTEKVMTRAPETYAITTPPRYKTVWDTVQTGGSRYWSVTRDPRTGKLVGCWITKPVRYASVPRTVMVSPGEVIPHSVPAQYGYRSQIVQTAPGYKAWAPVSYGHGGFTRGYDIYGERGGGYGPSYSYAASARRIHSPGYYPRHHHHRY